MSERRCAMGSVIKVNDVSMMFNLSSEKIDSIKE